MHLIALFMSTLVSFIFVLLVLPQHNRLYLIWFIKSELKIMYKEFSFKKYLVLYRTPIAFNNLVLTISIFYVYLKLSSIITPKYL